MTNEEYFKLFHKAKVNLVAFKPVFHCDDELRKMVEMAIEKERERIKEQNAPEIEKTNAYIKQLELEKMEAEVLHNEHRKLLGEIKAMIEAARLAEREEIEKRVMELDETMATRANVINKAIRVGRQE